MSKSTVVSTVPFELEEPKPGLFPSLYTIPAAPKDGFSTLTVGDGYHLFLIPMTDDRTPPMKIIDTSERIAESLIADYIGSCLGTSYTPDADSKAPAIPGLFFFEGEYSKKEIGIKFFENIEGAKARTRSWFKRLVTMADDDWAKFHQHKMITDIQRGACNYLGIERDWNFNILTAKTTSCWSCKSPIHPLAITCNSCRAIINMEEYEKHKDRYLPTRA